MSKENVSRFFQFIQDDESAVQALVEVDVDSVVRVAAGFGFEFSATELESVLKEMIYSAESLPRGWGWPLVRRMRLVRR